MSQSFALPLGETRQRAILFPGRCVCCGTLPTTKSTLLISRLVTSDGEQEPVNLRYDVPHCDRCARHTRVIFLATMIPFLLGFISIGGGVFWVTWKGAMWLDDYGRAANANSWLVAAFAGMVAGLMAAFTFELVARILLLPVFGRTLLQAPLLLVQFFTDADAVAGVTVKPSADATVLHVTISNDSVAREFAEMNGTELVRSVRSVRSVRWVRWVRWVR